MPEFRTIGIVLKKMNYGEADRILRVFTRDFGLISVIARGVCKMKSKKSGSLELFTESSLQLHRRTGELYLVTQTTGARSLVGEMALPVLGVAYSAAEWIIRLLPAEKPAPEVYDLLRTMLVVFSTVSSLPLSELVFQAKLLDLLGYLPEDFREERTQKLVRFLVATDLPEIQRLEDDPAVFQKIKGTLNQVFESITERKGEVTAVTASWI